jgi:hypothetical protein
MEWVETLPMCAVVEDGCGEDSPSFKVFGALRKLDKRLPDQEKGLQGVCDVCTAVWISPRSYSTAGA